MMHCSSPVSGGVNITFDPDYWYKNIPANVAQTKGLKAALKHS